MYLCGHPGTGKTSSLNYVLGQMLNEGQYAFKPFLFNAMVCPDVRSFAIKLYEKLYEVHKGSQPKFIDHSRVDDEDMA